MGSTSGLGNFRSKGLKKLILLSVAKLIISNDKVALQYIAYG